MKDRNIFGKKYHIITYGCQMNKNDSERMAGMLENIGYEEVDQWEEANLVVLNTCSIRDRAERRVVGKFQILHHYRTEQKKDMELAIAGCMPQHAKEFIRDKIPYLNYVVGVNNMELLPEFIHNKTSVIDQLDQMRPNRRNDRDVLAFEEKLNVQKRIKGNKAWISIMFGCDKFCTYCIVPFTRGREMSRKKENIFAEIAELENKGIDQVVLLGQNVNSYGISTYKQDSQEDSQSYDFADLIEDVALKFPWINQIDFITSHPKDMNKKLIDVISKYPTISKDIHFPLQHGHNDILEKMNRGYTVETYLEKVDYIRKCIPKAKIGTDLIVGFPGETEEHFNQMLAICREIQFDYANTAAFSIRPGTKAALMEDQIDEDVKKARLNILNRTLNHIYREKGVMRPVLG